MYHAALWLQGAIASRQHVKAAFRQRKRTRGVALAPWRDARHASMAKLAYYAFMTDVDVNEPHQIVERLLRYAHTDIRLVVGSPLDHLSEALYVAVNARAVLASGLAGSIRLLGGAEIERELRLHGQLLVGGAYRTSGGRLASRGLKHVIHGVTVSEPGASPRRVSVEDAFGAALLLLSDLRARTATFPEIGTRVPGLTLVQSAGLLASILAGALRRQSPLEHITIAGLHLEYLRAVRDGLIQEGATLA